MRSFGLKLSAGDGLMSTDGLTWKARRAILTPIFAQATHHQHLFGQHVTRLLDLIPEDGFPLSICNHFLIVWLSTPLPRYCLGNPH